jgi:hypothetical protein
LGTATGVGDNDGGTAGGFKGGGRGTEGCSVDGAASREVGSGTAMGVRDDDGVTAGGVEAKGGDNAVSREEVETPREAAVQRAGNLGSLTAQTKISPRLGFRISGVTPLYLIRYWYRLT